MPQHLAYAPDKGAYQDRQNAHGQQGNIDIRERFKAVRKVLEIETTDEAQKHPCDDCFRVAQDPQNERMDFHWLELANGGSNFGDIGFAAPPDGASR